MSSRLRVLFLVLALIIAILGLLLLGCMNRVERFEDGTTVVTLPTAPTISPATPATPAAPVPAPAPVLATAPTSIPLPTATGTASSASSPLTTEQVAAVVGGPVQNTINALSPKEKELFEDLKSNKLDNVQVDTLISAGILNTALFQKFLNILGEQDKRPVDIEPFSDGPAWASA